MLNNIIFVYNKNIMNKEIKTPLIPWDEKLRREKTNRVDEDVSFFANFARYSYLHVSEPDNRGFIPSHYVINAKHTDYYMLTMTSHIDKIIVISLKGTDLLNPKDLINDAIYALFKKVPFYSNDYVLQAIDDLKTTYPGYKIVFSSHSLGAIKVTDLITYISKVGSSLDNPYNDKLYNMIDKVYLYNIYDGPQILVNKLSDFGDMFNRGSVLSLWKYKIISSTIIKDPVSAIPRTFNIFEDPRHNYVAPFETISPISISAHSIDNFINEYDRINYPGEKIEIEVKEESIEEVQTKLQDYVEIESQNIKKDINNLDLNKKYPFLDKLQELVEKADQLNKNIQKSLEQMTNVREKAGKLSLMLDTNTNQKIVTPLTDMKEKEQLKPLLRNEKMLNDVNNKIIEKYEKNELSNEVLKNELNNINDQLKINLLDVINIDMAPFAKTDKKEKSKSQRDREMKRYRDFNRGRMMERINAKPNKDSRQVNMILDTQPKGQLSRLENVQYVEPIPILGIPQPAMTATIDAVTRRVVPIQQRVPRSTMETGSGQTRGASVSNIVNNPTTQSLTKGRNVVKEVITKDGVTEIKETVDISGPTPRLEPIIGEKPGKYKTLSKIKPVKVLGTKKPKKDVKPNNLSASQAQKLVKSYEKGPRVPKSNQKTDIKIKSN